MSREIKFRAWNSAEKRMYGNVGIDPYAKEARVFDASGAIRDMYGSVPALMQFTDYADKNKREIYEGDFLANEWGKYRVYWDRGGFIIQSEDGMRHNIGDIDVVTLQIIGNRYENPEFLPFFAALEENHVDNQ